MKKSLIQTIRTIPNLESAWRTISENGRTSASVDTRAEIAAFNEDASSKLRSLHYRLSRNLFEFVPARGVPIPKFDSKGKKTGKVRPLVLAPVESRIVQRAILNVIVDVPLIKPFVKTPYSFGGIRSDRAKRLPDGTRVPRKERLSAVPAAIHAVLDSMREGSRYVACADIESFFTKISKARLVSIVDSATNEPDFTRFFEKAITVELKNLDSLRNSGGDWPIEDIGVAQGNSLSPLLGNMILASFDAEMNKGDCRCIRYIDDLIILAPTQKAANARLRRAAALLDELGMRMSPEKSSKVAASIDDGFDFLGINFCSGAIRPGQKAQTKFVLSVDALLDKGRRSLRAVQEGKFSERTHTLLGTLRRLDGMIDGWGKHYWFLQ